MSERAKLLKKHLLIMATLRSVIFLFAISVAQWIEHNSPALPRGAAGMATGYYNGSIFLLYVLHSRYVIDSVSIVSVSLICSICTVGAGAIHIN